MNGGATTSYPFDALAQEQGYLSHPYTPSRYATPAHDNDINNESGSYTIKSEPSYVSAFCQRSDAYIYVLIESLRQPTWAAKMLLATHMALSPRMHAG